MADSLPVEHANFHAWLLREARWERADGALFAKRALPPEEIGKVGKAAHTTRCYVTTATRCPPAAFSPLRLWTTWRRELAELFGRTIGTFNARESTDNIVVQKRCPGGDSAKMEIFIAISQVMPSRVPFSSSLCIGGDLKVHRYLLGKGWINLMRIGLHLIPSGHLACPIDFDMRNRIMTV